jgi:hypothetical protein
MSQSDDSPWLRHHRQRWLRHDAHLWVRPDAARFFAPGTDPAVINPTLPRKPDAAKAAAFEAELGAEVAKGYRLIAVLREEVPNSAPSGSGSASWRQNTARASRACRPAIRAAGSGATETRVEQALASAAQEAGMVKRARTAQKMSAV